jgi:hypothetical protein
MERFIFFKFSRGCRCVLLLLFAWLTALGASATDVYTYTPYVK